MELLDVMTEMKVALYRPKHVQIKVAFMALCEFLKKLSTREWLWIKFNKHQSACAHGWNPSSLEKILIHTPLYFKF